MKKQPHTYGYYHITICANGPTLLMRSNSERAFIIAQLQYFLSPRLVLGDIPAYRQLASCIDLLAFSIKSEAIHLLIFSIDADISRYFTDCITTQFQHYRLEQHLSLKTAEPQTCFTIQKLAGPHQALGESLALHLLHEDWEYDRYSSIGFYLHDRRGDWMRTWRLATLYENNPELYRTLLFNQLRESHPRDETEPALTVGAQYLAQEAHG